MKGLSVEEARGLVELIKLAVIPLSYREHYEEREWERDFDRQDLFYLIHHGKIDSEPAYDPEHDNFRVRISGQTTEGRRARVVLGVRPGERIAYVITIIGKVNPR